MELSNGFRALFARSGIAVVVVVRLATVSVMFGTSSSINFTVCASHLEQYRCMPATEL